MKSGGNVGKCCREYWAVCSHWRHARRFGSLSVSTNLQELQSQLSRTPLKHLNDPPTSDPEIENWKSKIENHILKIWLCRSREDGLELLKTEGMGSEGVVSSQGRPPSTPINHACNSASYTHFMSSQVLHAHQYANTIRWVCINHNATHHWIYQYITHFCQYWLIYKRIRWHTTHSNSNVNGSVHVTKWLLRLVHAEMNINCYFKFTDNRAGGARRLLVCDNNNRNVCIRICWWTVGKLCGRFQE